MTYILTCGCESQYGGFPSEWDGETRECEPAVFYGCLCDKHFGEYDARPAQLEPRELSDEEIWELHQKYIDEVSCGHSMKTVGFIEFARAILKKASEPKTYKPKIVDMVLRTDNQGNVLPQKQIKESE